jgi:hypothetical protein
LEIGLWESAADMYYDICKQMNKMSGQKQPSPDTIRNNLLADAKRRLGHRIGSAYKKAVVSCLSDEFKEHLGKDDFAITFQRLVVQKVDIKRLLTE